MAPALTRFTLSKDERLHGKRAVDRLFAKGKFRSCGCLRYCYLIGNGLEYTRIMVSVPKRLFKRAVRRNALKRRIRESYRLQKHILPSGSGVDILFVYTDREFAESREIFTVVGRILSELSVEIRKHYERKSVSGQAETGGDS